MRSTTSGKAAAPKKKKPAPKKSAPKKAAYAAKMKHYATNESNAAKHGKKPSSVAKAKPKKELSAKQLFKQQTKEMYKGINKRLAEKPAQPRSSRTASTRKKSSSDWEAGMSVRDWARGQDWYKGKSK